MADTIATEYARRLAVMAVKEAVDLLEQAPDIHTLDPSYSTSERMVLRVVPRSEWRLILQAALLTKLVQPNG